MNKSLVAIAVILAATLVIATLAATTEAFAFKRVQKNIKSFTKWK